MGDDDATCADCGEPILPGEAVTSVPFLAANPEESRIIYLHEECDLRRVVGSLGHQQRTCSCYGGEGNGDDPELSRRENARRAAAYARRLR